MIKLENVNKNYGKERILHNFNLEVKEGEFVAIMGKSGKGKTTLLNILSGITSIDSGKYFLEGIEVNRLSKTKKNELRSSKIGYIVQNYALLNELSVERNIKIGDKLFKREPSLEFNNIAEALEIDYFLNKTPLELSGGQRQRVAIARAIYNKPRVLLMDEPTGNLDGDTAKKVMELIKEVQEKQKLTIILVTHDKSMAAYANRVINL